MTLLAVLAGGALGSVLRALATAWNGRWPWGTAVANLAGAGLVGVIAAAEVEGPWLAFASAGMAGGLTTFSTWMVEAEALRREGRVAAAALHVGGTLAAGVGLVVLAHVLVGG